MPACDERFGSNELAERLSESAERVLSGRIHQIRIQGDCPAGKPRGRDAGGVQDSEAAHLNSPKRALESQISMSHLVPLLEFNLQTKTLPAISQHGQPTIVERTAQLDFFKRHARLTAQSRRDKIAHLWGQR